MPNKPRRTLTPYERRLASRYIAEEIEALKHGSAHVKTRRQAIAVGLNRARRKHAA
jgi:hypothetical protein